MKIPLHYHESWSYTTDNIILLHNCKLFTVMLYIFFYIISSTSLEFLLGLNYLIQLNTNVTITTDPILKTE